MLLSMLPMASLYRNPLLEYFSERISTPSTGNNSSLYGSLLGTELGGMMKQRSILDGSFDAAISNLLNNNTPAAPSAGGDAISRLLGLTVIDNNAGLANLIGNPMSLLSGGSTASDPISQLLGQQKPNLMGLLSPGDAMKNNPLSLLSGGGLEALLGKTTLDPTAKPDAKSQIPPEIPPAKATAATTAPAAKAGEQKPITAFDEAYYLQTYPDVAEAVKNGSTTALAHYNRFGKSEGRNPNALFNEKAYLAANPDVAEALKKGLASGFDHYITIGIKEGRKLAP